MPSRKVAIIFHTQTNYLNPQLQKQEFQVISNEIMVAEMVAD